MMQQRRRELGMTRPSAAKAIGVSVRTLYDWENGKIRPKTERFPIIAMALHCTIEDIWIPVSEKSGPQIPKECQTIVQRRREMGITQVELSRRSGVSLDTIRHMERGFSTPHWETRQKLRAALGLPEERYYSVEERNALFLEMEPRIRWVIKQNLSKLRVNGADFEDIYQDLAVCALRAIDRYNPEHGTTVRSFVTHTMLEHMKNILIHLRRHGLSSHEADYIQTGTVVSLDALVEAGVQF